MSKSQQITKILSSSLVLALIISSGISQVSCERAVKHVTKASTHVVDSIERDRCIKSNAIILKKMPRFEPKQDCCLF